MNEAPQAPYGHPTRPQQPGAAYAPPQPWVPHVPQHPPYAGWSQRAGAFLLDVLINFGPFWLLVLIGGLIDDMSPGDSGEVVGAILGWAGILAMIPAVTFQLVREGRTGQTVGKKALGIRAVRDRDGRTPGIGLALGRRLAQFLNYPLFGLGWWLALGDPKKQTFADKITSVVVVRA
ncbi:RDD family protein [Actinomadura rugatobispora]|uniref:RDD family protein n=1 Tax=Actinomadura rugatobispora TaxID=1994 RepID=A0ABW0ZSJ9_9ACTN|nr:hypothetical protein GCM10010200_096670 [Actinomadura rugatobispora]